MYRRYSGRYGPHSGTYGTVGYGPVYPHTVAHTTDHVHTHTQITLFFTYTGLCAGYT